MIGHSPRLILNGAFLRDPATGTGQYTLHLLRELDALVDEPVTVVVPGADDGRGAVDDGPWPDALSGTRTRFVAVRTPALLGENLAKVWFEQIGFPSAVNRLLISADDEFPTPAPPSTVHRPSSVAHIPYFGPPLRCPAPVVTTIHDLIMLVLPEHRGSPQVRLYTWLAGRAARRARLILTDSECSRRDVTERLGIPADRVRVVPLACDDRFRPPAFPEATAAVRRDYNLDRPYVFYLGGLDWRKNVTGLIEAFGRVPTDALLAIGGALPPPGNPLFPDVPAAVRASPAADRIRLIGRVAEEDKPALYAGADVFVFPSRYEGFGLTVLEALACGTPVICSDAASLPEVAGDAAWLVPPDDLDGLARAIDRVLTDPARRADLAVRGPRQAARFTWRRTAEATLAAYREVAAGG